MNFFIGLIIELNTYFNTVILKLLKYVGITVEISILSMILSLVISILLVSGLKNPFFKQITKVYISFFRGTPLLVQLYVLAFGLPNVFPAAAKINIFILALFGLSLNNSAYLSEIIRGSLNGVDKDQLDASLSVGMTKFQTYKEIIFPQTFRIALPSIGNNFVGLIKSSSLIFSIGITEILAEAKLIASVSYNYMGSYMGAALVYWGIVIIIEQIQKRIEKKLEAPYL